jgi:hypothetical protein
VFSSCDKYSEGKKYACLQFRYGLSVSLKGLCIESSVFQLCVLSTDGGTRKCRSVVECVFRMHKLLGSILATKNQMTMEHLRGRAGGR